METGLDPKIFSELDIHFARFMDRLCGGGSPEVLLAAALVSRSRGEGHICIDLSSCAGKKLSADPLDPVVCPDLPPWLKALEAARVVGQPGDYRPLVLAGSRLYLYRYWSYERKLADLLRTRTSGDGDQIDEPLLREGLDRLFPAENPGETDWQKMAAFTAVRERFCVISGGPGTGKTFTVAKILALLLEQAGPEALRIALAAPTGKAAARLQEAIKNAKGGFLCSAQVMAAIPEVASTIHRLLRSIPDSPYFRHDAENPLAVDVVVVDEASMIDLALLAKLVQAVPAKARLLLLGDKDQLASVEAGAVLGDICDTGNFHGYSRSIGAAWERITGDKLAAGPAMVEDAGLQDSIVELKKSYRFGSASGIGTVSRAVNEGESARAMDLLRGGGSGDVQWRELPAAETLPRALRERVLDGFSGYLRATEPLEIFDRFNGFRILCALREGPYGVEALNLMAELILRREGLIRREGRWYAGRPVMITRNDYNMRLFNGDVGIALPDPATNDELGVFFPSADGGLRKFAPLRLPAHETVYAMTVHKSQGSEFGQVLFLLPDRSSPVLTRELIYTGMTRAREKVELWGRKEVFHSAVARRIERTSGLREALWKSGKDEKG